MLSKNRPGKRLPPQPNTQTYRSWFRQDVLDSIQAQRNTLFNVPTALGKTYTVATIPWGQYPCLTNDRPVVHFHKTRDARDEAAEESRKANLTVEVLQGREELSLPASGAFDEYTIRGIPLSEWIHQQCERNGLSYWQALRLAQSHLNGTPLWTDEEPLTGVQWNDLLPLAGSEVDIIHATHQFAFAPPLRNATVTVFDEQPDFTQTLKDSQDELSRERIRRAVVAYLDESNAPIHTFEELLRQSQSGVSSLSQGKLQNALTHQPDESWYVSKNDAHPLAPALVRAIYRAQPRSNGRCVGTATYTPQSLARFEQVNRLNAEQQITVVIDSENTIQTVRVHPDMSRAHVVLGLDAFPTESLWELNTGVSLETNYLLKALERLAWRRDEKQLNVVQVGSNANYYTRGIENPQKVGAIVKELRDRYDSAFSTAITSKAASDTLEQIMEKEGVHDPTVLTYGEQNSRNVLGDEDVGLVVGCIDMGDESVLNRLAELGLEAKPERTNDDHPDCSGSGCRGCNHTGKRRAPGRGFVGPDADVAKQICDSVRCDEVKQAISRYGRNPEDPTDSATVFVTTNVIRPSLLLDEEGDGVDILAEKQGDIVAFTRSQTTTTAREVSDNIRVSRKHASDVLKGLVERGYASVDREAGSYNRDVFTVASDTPTDRFVDLG